MYKIIFLDDELITLRMLEQALDWQQYNICVSGMAMDGDEGIALFKQVQPDIVIADIRMPKMNGIEFARAIRETQSNVKLLLLSAYAEFEYAQNALTYQISDYLLKPLDENKLKDAIVRIVRELDRDLKVSSTIVNYQLEQAERQLQQLFHRHRENPNANATLPTPDDVQAALEQVDTLIHILRVMEPHELQPSNDIEAIRLLLKDHLGVQTAVVSLNQVELIVLTTHAHLEAKVESLTSVLRTQQRTILMGLSVVDSRLDLVRACDEAESALYVCFYTGEQLSCYIKQPPFSKEVLINLADFEHEVNELVEQGKPDGIIASLHKQLAAYLDKRVSPAVLYEFAFDIFNWIKIALTKQYPSKSFSRLAPLDRDRLRACGQKEILLAYLTHYLRTIGDAVSNLLASDPSYYIVQRAKDYARAHYTLVDFSLEDAATYVGLSKNHFSRVFHDVTGIKFWDFVTELRIEKAKELLKKSNHSNYEICCEIGYTSEFYFSKIFKKVVGVAARDFRRL